ncbi:YukJ family protein [Falsibacillus albus]|uniref:DUF2278 family protein n=1 Tax=Falsibacillus albus TaxID=2478915 RepID=A0A3L7JTR8_9BACI|nr:YukJ family protein [Falsibacillus albus]RLQ94218.1 DUF2278 family protein [Falsibacillus albus]
MPIKHYGVLKGTPVKALIGSEKSPHFQILVHDENGEEYRIAINIKSQGYPSEVLYLVSHQLKNEETDHLLQLKSGFTQIKQNNPPIGIDFIKAQWFDPADMVALPPEVEGPDNDLNDKIQHYVNEAIKNKSTIYAFGAKWGPEKNKSDQYFHFTPGQGIHDIHMNQGNEGRWEKDNGSFQDGALFIQLEDRWVGIFLAFQSQSWCTDEDGNPIKPAEECDHLKEKNQVDRHSHTS